VNREAPISISNVMYLHKGQPTRIGFRFENDKKVRFAKKTGETIG
jgi:large subunit ribosomal protein L24